MQECCVTLGGGAGGAPRTACVTTGMCRGIAATCSSAASCNAGEVCCAAIAFGGTGGATSTATCETSCANLDAGRAIAAQLCTTNAECPAGETCQPDGLGLDVCRAARGGFDGGIPRPDGGFMIPDGGFQIPDGGFGGGRDGGRRMRDAAAD
jgi:hypothetical protein